MVANHDFAIEVFGIQTGGKMFEGNIDFDLNWYTGGYQVADYDLAIRLL